jgi:intracellular sulfur oxidation DsrE/DsrF family protein
MKTISFARIAMLTALAGAAHLYAQAPLAVPGAPVARDVPGAKQLPDPNTTYKVVFSIGKPAPEPGKANPALTSIANYVNTLAKYGVPPEHRKIVVMIHHRGDGWQMILKNDAHRRATEGIDNPSLEMIQKLQKAGVEFRVCGQLVVARKINPEDILPGFQTDLWALTSLVDLQMAGYVHVAM